MEPDVPDTRKMLIRVRRSQSMSALASRYGVSLGQLKAWNRTHRNDVRAGQVIVLHVPVGKRVPSEPGPERLATDVRGGGVQKISAHVGGDSADDDDKASKTVKSSQPKGRGKSGVVKASAHAGKTGGVKKVSTAAEPSAAKSPKAAAPSRQKTAANAKKGKQ
jgi:membrane-bound lytic murein transglycosylase D